MEKRKLTIPEIQKRLKEMGRRAAMRKEKKHLSSLYLKIPQNLPVPYYNLMN